MKDLTKEMRSGKVASPKMHELLDKEKAQARKRIVERGIVHFRADAEFMDALLRAAKEAKIAPGTLCRQIVWDYLQSQPTSNMSLAQYNALMKKLERGQEEIRGELKELKRRLAKSS